MVCERPRLATKSLSYRTNSFLSVLLMVADELLRSKCMRTIKCMPFPLWLGKYYGTVDQYSKALFPTVQSNSRAPGVGFGNAVT